MIKKSIKKLALAMGIFLGLSTPLNTFAKSLGEYPSGEILSFGSSLSQAQQDQLRAYFKAPDTIEAIYVTSEVAIKQLGLEGNAYDNFTGGWYSSAYVKLNSEETGVNVTANNLTLVTNDMLSNALITSGILNADVIASSPFPVTGESALAGILAGAEKIMGGELNIEGKQTAQKEIEVSLDLADEIGQTEATALINEIKTEVIKDKPSTEKQIEKIVEKAESKYDVNLNSDIKDEVVSLMSDVNKLDLDYDKLKDTLNKASSKFKDDMKALGKEIKDSGILERIFNWFKDLWNSIFGPKDNSTTDTNTTIDDNLSNGTNISTPNDETSTSIDNSQSEIPSDNVTDEKIDTDETPSESNSSSNNNTDNTTENTDNTNTSNENTNNN